MSHREGIEEALCFGWIDTIMKKLDEDRYERTFMKRTDKANWSTNTLSYAKKLLKDKKMFPLGIKRYKEGLKRKPHDFGRRKNPQVPEILKKELSKEKKLEENFNNFSPSYRKALLYNLLSAKLYGKKFWSEEHFYRNVGSVNSETMKHYVEDSQDKHWETKPIIPDKVIVLQKRINEF
jgi:uncharacterized protein YdeI (YjbR/CyaY-like superfamily)